METETAERPEIMKINGLTVDAQAIADGMYDIICQKGEEAIVAFGMMPKWIMDTLDRMLREKVLQIAAQQIGCEPNDPTFLEFLSEEKIKDTMDPIIHEITVGIYRAAAKKGMMRV
jgi:hypothetical protein